MITELVIDRSKWGTGALENEDGSMCCLGFLSKACGYTDLFVGRRPMNQMTYPRFEWDNVPEVFRDTMTRLPSDACTAWAEAAKINDGNDTWADKEVKLISLFAKHGIALTFVGPLK